MDERGYRPDIVVCSPALRTRETLKGLGATFAAQQAIFPEGLYSGGGGEYLAAVHSAGNAAGVIIIGHNPMIESVSAALAGTRDAEAAGAMAGGFPTCGLAIVRFSGALSGAVFGAGKLEEFLTPASA